MSDLKQPTLKADGLMRNVTGVPSKVAPAATGSDAPTRKASKKKSAAPAKKPVARKKVTGSAKKPAAGKKAGDTATSPEPASIPASQDAAAPQAPAAKPVLSGEARQRMISQAAYLISMKRHAGANGPEADWLYAETVIDMVFDRTD